MKVPKLLCATLAMFFIISGGVYALHEDDSAATKHGKKAVEDKFPKKPGPVNPLQGGRNEEFIAKNLERVNQLLSEGKIVPDAEVAELIDEFTTHDNQGTLTEFLGRMRAMGNVDEAAISYVLAKAGITESVTLASGETIERLESLLSNLDSLAVSGVADDRVLTATAAIINDDTTAGQIYQKWATGGYDYLSVGITDDAQKKSLLDKILNSGIRITEEQIRFSLMNETLVTDLTAQIQELVSKGQSPSLQAVRDLVTAK